MPKFRCRSGSKNESLMGHPDFRLSTPNRVTRSLAGTLPMNLSGFNAANGEGYRGCCRYDPETGCDQSTSAARMSTGFRSWRILNEVRRKAVAAQLERIVSTPKLSRDTFEIISKTLNG